MNRLVISLGLIGGMVATTLAADWPQWRGPDRTGVSQETGLLKKWSEGGPPLRWKATDIGTGYSAPAISQGKVFLQTTRDDSEYALALDEKTGKQLWSTAIGLVGKNQGPQYPGTRATPTVDGDKLYSLASDGQLTCLDRDGAKQWSVHLKEDFAGEVGAWAYTESVLVDGDWVICTPGGSEATLAALDKKTGKVVWKSAVPGGDVADYASIMPIDVNGKKQYVQFMRKGLVGVDAETGKFLWRYDRTIDRGANILTPVVLGNKVFSAGSRTGGGLIELSADGDSIMTKEVYFDRAIAPSIGGAVLYDGHLYGSAGESLFCVDFNTGEVKWTERSVGPASVCMADGRLYARGYNSGDIALIEPTPEEYREVGRFKQPDLSKVRGWPHPVVANGGLYLRDQSVLLCFDVADPKEN